VVSEITCLFLKQDNSIGSDFMKSTFCPTRIIESAVLSRTAFNVSTISSRIDGRTPSAGSSNRIIYRIDEGRRSGRRDTSHRATIYFVHLYFRVLAAFFEIGRRWRSTSLEDFLPRAVFDNFLKSIDD
jgi:hypothetical protein